MKPFTEEAARELVAAAIDYAATKQRLYRRPVPKGADADYAKIMDAADQRLCAAAEPFMEAMH